MFRRFLYLTTIALVWAFIAGCSTNAGPVNVGQDGDDANIQVMKSVEEYSGHSLWGLWTFICEPEAGSIEAVPLREGEFHLNALRFLEPPLNIYLTIESPHFQGNVVDVNIGIRHPFLGAARYTGFDVCGIIFTKGAKTGFSDPDIIMAGGNDTRLLNPDGFTRWWNPTEFPHTQTMFGYKDGLLGMPYESAGYNCTLNGYKYFCDDLDPIEPLSGIDVDRRGVFTTGQKNIRHYTIQIGDSGLVFNYAIDACWKNPIGEPPFHIPDDFPPEANRFEAYRVSVNEVANSLWNDGVSSGGSLSLDIDVYDHFNAELNSVLVESPGSFGPASAGAASGGGYGYSTYEIDISNANPLNSGTIDLLITVQCEVSGYQDLLPDKPQCAYFNYKASVSDVPPGYQGKTVVGLPDWCALTENCTNGVDNLKLVDNIVQWNVGGPFNDEMKVKWWEGHLSPKPPYATYIIENRITSLGYIFERTSEPVFNPEGCRMIIVVFVKAPGGTYIPFTPEEAANMKNFVANGGILCLLVEHPNYFDDVVLEPLLDMLGVPLSYGGGVEPPSTYTTTTDITDHFLTAGVETFQYWTAGEWVLESDECEWLVRSPTGENMVVVAPIDVG